MIRNSFICISLCCFLFFVFADASNAGGNNLHPLNKRLIDLGYMPYPKHNPNVPRITGNFAKYLYDKGEALFLYVASTNDEQILNSIYMTEREAWDCDPNLLPFGTRDTLVVY